MIHTDGFLPEEVYSKYIPVLYNSISQYYRGLIPGSGSIALPYIPASEPFHKPVFDCT